MRFKFDASLLIIKCKIFRSLQYLKGAVCEAEEISQKASTNK